ncbi:MAG TPA: TlpA disulfide reductase family protein, partial [Anaerolineales bacterium]|nr:TlpA disulfide reductase family protein [Anaerolineales bacterium]
GQVVIVNLWASWCGPCRAEMPALQSVYESLSAEGLVVLAVNSTAQDTEEAARAFVTEHALTFPVLLDREDSVSQAYRLRSLPSTFIVDRQGVIDSVLIGGPLAEAVLRSKVADLLAEAP